MVADRAARAVRAVLDGWEAAVRAKDLESLVAPFAPDVLSFDVVVPLQATGAEVVRERARTWLGSFDGPVGYEVRDLEVHCGDDVAFAHFVYRVSGRLRSGGAVDMWVRATFGLRRVEGAWRVVHSHHSVPFDPATGLAALDAQP